MPRIIDADELLRAIRTDIMGGLNYERFIREAPTVDAVEVVRCKDCQYRGSTAECLEQDADWFCADGKRREDAEIN